MTLNVILTFSNEFQASSVFQNAVCNASPLAITSATSRSFSNPLCISSASGVVTLTFDAGNDSALWSSSDPLVFTLTLDTVDDLQVTSPYNYRS